MACNAHLDWLYVLPAHGKPPRRIQESARKRGKRTSNGERRDQLTHALHGAEL